METFDMELKNYYNKVKSDVQTEHLDYIKSHPEIRDILNDFISTLLLEKPDDIFSYAKNHFAFFNK
jgi:guanylate kinase